MRTRTPDGADDALPAARAATSTAERDCGLHAPRIRAASTAAFRALSTPTAATGTPGGICAIASSASRPSSTESDERSGTPITGRSRVRGRDARQRGRQAGAADQHPEPALARRPAVLGDGLRLPVRRADVELVRDPALVELVERALHALAVRLRADEDADDRRLRRQPQPPPRCRCGSARRRTRSAPPLRKRARARLRSSGRARSR